MNCIKFRRIIFPSIVICLIVLLTACVFVACDNTDAQQRQVPVYKGMVISSRFAQASASALPADDNGNHYGHYKGDHEHRNDDFDEDKPFDEKTPSIEDKAQSTLDVVGAGQDIYYADAGQDVFITIKLSNPDSYEILSFTLNGKKYSNYMFEEGSDMENLVLKVNVGNVGGIHDYTIDAIKYVDGTDIKDVRMDGDRTVKAGVRAYDQTYASVSNEKKSMTSISFDVQVVDLYSLVQASGGYAKAVLYDGVNMTSKDITVGEKTSVTFDNLTPNTVYQYGVVALYDDLSGSGIKLNTLYKKAVYTDTIVLFKDIEVGQETLSWGYVWNDAVENKTITALELMQNDVKVKDVEATATSIDGLKTNNEYTLKATYKNLQNQDESISITFTTLEKAVPGVEIANVVSTQTSVDFTINVTDTDSVGAIAKIELLHGEGAPIVVENTNRTIENLLSNNNYTIKVTYTYDLNDGAGNRDIVKTVDFKTLEKVVPSVEIANVVPTQTSVDFAINVTDTDNVGAIAKIELLHGEDTPIVVENTVRTFANLLSNNDYTVKVTYAYDLNDGVGEQQIVKTADIKTKSKATPSATISNLSNTQNTIECDVAYTDVDGVGQIESIALFKGETKVATTSERTHVVFDALECDTEYTLVVTYKYDLNDGKGEQSASQKAKRYTAPQFELVEATCANTSAVSKGDIIYFEAVINNPSGVTVEQVKINDQYYAPSAGTTKNSIIVRITVKDQFEGGNTDLMVTEIKGTLHGQDLLINLKENNKASVFVNGELNVKSISIVGEDGNECEMVVANETYYYKIEIDNKTGYSIKSATIQDDRFPEPGVYNKADNKIIQTQNDYFLVPFIPWFDNSNPMGAVTIKKIEYGNEYLGEKIKDINGVSSEMFVAVENEDAIIVSTPEDLKNMNEPRYYVLQNDIDLKGMEWIAPSDFKGYFDGQGHVIKNISFVGTIENTESNLGLFKNVTGYIKNLSLTGRIIVTARNSRVNIGGLCAMATRACIKNVFNYIDISVLCENDEDKYLGVSIGGIAAQFYGDIINCANFGTLYSNGNGASVAGLSQCGCLRIRNSFNKGNITGYFCGGLVCATGDNSLIVDSFNSGDINARWSAGGLLWNDDDKQIIIKNSYSAGTIKADQYSGDLIAGGSPLIENSYYTASNDNRFGEQKTLAEIIEIMRAIWDNNIWDFDNLDENGNPTLKK